MSKKYDNDFKQMITALAQSDYHTLASISEDYGVSTATISNWLAADKTTTI
ncbi:transposase [uncultured Leuconostoc sp.]|uniref:transposase n=1 Tax=uncultured Leuconostoc sp. TaxID=173262 RepID=UPI0025FA0BD3|nr:transposase [uncultured Leuconostoc sp.]